MLDYMVMEAVAMKVSREEEQERKQAEVKRKQEEVRKQLVQQFG